VPLACSSQKTLPILLEESLSSAHAPRSIIMLRAIAPLPCGDPRESAFDRNVQHLQRRRLAEQWFNVVLGDLRSLEMTYSCAKAH
jgi:hypothetical protein